MQRENPPSIAKDKGGFTLEDGGQRGKKLQEAAALQTLIGTYEISRADASLSLQEQGTMKELLGKVVEQPISWQPFKVPAFSGANQVEKDAERDQTPAGGKKLKTFGPFNNVVRFI